VLRKAVAPVVALLLSVFASLAQDAGPATKFAIRGDNGIWTSFAVKDFQVLIPGKPGDVLDEASGEVRSIHTLTEIGTFSVVIKDLGKQVDARNTESVVDGIAIAALSAKTKLIEKHDVEYEGTRGEQVSYLEDGNRMFARIFVLSDRLIIMSASFREGEYCPEFDPLIDRFFDSVRVKVPLLLA